MQPLGFLKFLPALNAVSLPLAPPLLHAWPTEPLLALGALHGLVHHVEAYLADEVLVDV